jgi:hypothetical protein
VEAGRRLSEGHHHDLDGWASRAVGNALYTAAGFTTRKWEGDTLTARTTHVKTAWIRRGNGIPGSDQSTYTVHITRHDDLLTIVTVQEDPVYLTEPHVVSRVWRLDPRGNQGGRSICNTANEIPGFRTPTSSRTTSLARTPRRTS